VNGSSAHLPEEWLFRFGGADASGWLTAFQADADAAVCELLWNRFYFGPLNPIERGQLLATWLEALGDTGQFAPRLDSAFAGWVQKNWGRFDHPAVTMVSAWSCLASVIEFSARLPQSSRLVHAAGALREHFSLRERFLGSFSTAPAADPLGFYLAVIAEFQGGDRSLAGFWQRLCDLPDGVAFYHARYAMQGLRRLKAANNRENGSLRAEVVLGLLRLATAFDRLVREGGLAEQVARSTFRRVAVQVAGAYPGSPRWEEHGLAPALEMHERPQKWVLEAVRPLAAAVKQEQVRANRPHVRPRPSIQADPAWTDRARALATELRNGRTNFLPDIERLLAEQRHYAEATGGTYFIVHSLCNFASRILRLRPDIAGRWALEARSWEPHNAFTWTTIKDVLLKQKNVSSALRFAWVACKRFPENIVARTGLAEVLKATERYPEAEEVCRQTIERFPEDVVARNGLAGVLKAAERYPEAEEVCRQTIERFPEDVFARTGLAEVLKAAERYPEAEEVYRQTIERFPEDVFARNGLADTLRRAHRSSDAEIAYRDSIATGYFDCTTYVGLAFLLLKRGEAGRAEALSLVEAALRLDPRNPYALSLKQKLETAQATDIAGIADEWKFIADEVLVASEATDQEDVGGVGGIEVGSLRSEQSSPETPLLFPGAHEEEAEIAQLEPSPIAARERPVDLLEVAAFVAEAQFFRSWARRVSPEQAPSLRQRAGELLARAEDLLPQDPQVAAEKAALECDDGTPDQAAQTLFTQLGKHPAAAPLLVLKARLDRETARREHWQLSEAGLAQLLQAPSRLRDTDPALTPVFHLEKGLAALALLDGAARLDTAAASLTNFRRTVAHRAAGERADRESSHDARTKETPRFHEWLQTTTNQRLFGGVPDPEAVRVEDVPCIEHLLTERPFAFDEVEDTIVDRLAYAGV